MQVSPDLWKKDETKVEKLIEMSDKYRVLKEEFRTHKLKFKQAEEAKMEETELKRLRKEKN